MNRVLVRPNKYDTNRANIVIYNWQNLSVVNVNVSQLGWKRGDSYELRNVQDYFGDVITGSYDGTSINIPMTNRKVARPTNWNREIQSVYPEFGVFVLIKS